MDKKTFWSIIERSKDEESQIEHIKNYLSSCSEEEIIEFNSNVNKQMEKSYKSSLWGAAYVIMGGCSDDGFEYFRGWLISQGESVFLKAVENPEYLAEYIPEYYREEYIVPELEEILSVAMDAFIYKNSGSSESGEELQTEFFNKLQKNSYRWKETSLEFEWNDDNLEEKFPKLWARFGEEPLD